MKGKNSHKPKLLGILLVGTLTAFTLTSCNLGGGSKDNNTKVESQDTVAQASETPSNGLSGEQTITGEILDMSCYMTHDAKGKGHQSCAQSCLDGGLPAGILSDAGQVYLLVENHDLAGAYEEAIKHGAQNVTITGTVVNKHGVQSLVVEKIKVEGTENEATASKGAAVEG